MYEGNVTSLVSYAVLRFLLIYIPNPYMCSSGLQGHFLLPSIPLTKALAWSPAPSPHPSLHFCAKAEPHRVCEEDKCLCLPWVDGKGSLGRCPGLVLGAAGLTPLPTRGETAKLWVFPMLRSWLR